MSIKKPTADAQSILDIVSYPSHSTILTMDENTYNGIHQIELLLTGWNHDLHGYRGQTNMSEIFKLGYYLGGVVSENDNEVELRFFKNRVR